MLRSRSCRHRWLRTPSDRLEAAEVDAFVADGLAAHGAGIIHRDVKPYNIFLAADERVKIIEFALAGISGSGQAD